MRKQTAIECWSPPQFLISGRSEEITLKKQYRNNLNNFIFINQFQTRWQQHFIYYMFKLCWCYVRLQSIFISFPIILRNVLWEMCLGSKSVDILRYAGPWDLGKVKPFWCEHDDVICFICCPLVTSDRQLSHCLSMLSACVLPNWPRVACRNII